MLGRLAAMAARFALVAVIAVSVSGCGLLGILGVPMPTPTGPWEPLATTHPDPTPILTGLHSPITQEEALRVAHAAAPNWKQGDVISVEEGTWGDLRNGAAQIEVAPEPAFDEPVWRVELGVNPGPMMGSGTIVLVRASDGVVLQMVMWIS